MTVFQIFIWLFLKEKKIFKITLTIVNEGSSLTIVKKGLSLTIVIETTNVIKRVAFGKTIVFWRKKYYMHLYWMSSYMRLNSCGRTKTPWYILKNYSIISTGDLQVGFLSSLTIVNKGSSLTIINEGPSLTIVNKGSSLTIVNETTNFIKNENVNIPRCA